MGAPHSLLERSARTLASTTTMHEPRAVAVAVPFYLPIAGSSNTAEQCRIPEELRASTSTSTSTSQQPLFLVCSSRKHPQRYVLPKGGIEAGEGSAEAAIREGWEEAGFRGRHLLTLGAPIKDARTVKDGKALDTKAPKAVYHFELVLVTSLEAEWPEKHERTRRWMSWQELQEAVRWRDENVEGLRRVPSAFEELNKLVEGLR